MAKIVSRYIRFREGITIDNEAELMLRLCYDQNRNVQDSTDDGGRGLRWSEL
jgi:hypothetical protein